MIFLLFTLSLTFITTGIWGLTLASEPTEMILFVLILLICFILLTYTIYRYRKKKEESDHVFDFLNCVDCGVSDFSSKKGFDCDCTPDCMN